jgi:hypothetical protein
MEQAPPGVVPNMDEIAKQMAQQQAQAQMQTPATLLINESAIRLGKRAIDGGVELDFILPFGLTVKVPFSNEGWKAFLENGQRAVSNVIPARSLPR